jgi:hypothetical protein
MQAFIECENYGVYFGFLGCTQSPRQAIRTEGALQP